MSQRLSPLKPTLHRWLAAAVVAAFSSTSAMAADNPPALNTAQLCSQRFSHAENTNGIPKQLLAAISATESGRWSDQAKTVVPWPWTINAGGQGYYFDSMNEAIAFANRLRNRGIDSFDVGCMQINMHHHPDAFANLNDAFDPERNVAYGAKFLRQNYDDLKSWPEAIAAYHSRTPEVGNPYYVNVRRNWQRVLQGGEFALAGAMPYAATMGGRAASYVAGVAINRGVMSAVGTSGQASAANAPLSAKPKDSTFQISVKDESGLHSIDESRRGRPLSSRMPAMAESSSSRVIHVGDKGLPAERSVASNAAAPEVLVIHSNGSVAKSPIAKAAPSRNVTLASIGSDNGGGNFVTGRQASAKHAPESLVAVSQPDSNAAPDAEVKRISSRKAGPNFIFD